MAWPVRLLFLLLPALMGACSEDKLDEYDASQAALNIAKGELFGSKSNYPEAYSFNAYFLGGDVSDYELRIPVRLQGVADATRDRNYRVAVVDEEQNSRMRLALVTTADFRAGIPEYQYVDISFTKNLSIAPAFWEKNSKLRRISYHPRKCAVFLRVSGITDPEWTDDGSSVVLDYWIARCTQWFLQHEEYDAAGNRIYFTD